MKQVFTSCPDLLRKKQFYYILARQKDTRFRKFIAFVLHKQLLSLPNPNPTIIAVALDRFFSQMTLLLTSTTVLGFCFLSINCSNHFGVQVVSGQQ
ncbi:hypothetical protein L6452_19654 [Arctium lappa]|uniref:Uncharacterized protein n=1 Tax=Arctium lappa TaxID=4217 RepID=A0ACB9B9Z7_ARCLA|nr:hypothetical protein L6452_19654 [Arctium lappa]